MYFFSFWLKTHWSCFFKNSHGLINSPRSAVLSPQLTCPHCSCVLLSFAVSCAKLKPGRAGRFTSVPTWCQRPCFEVVLCSKHPWKIHVDDNMLTNYSIRLLAQLKWHRPLRPWKRRLSSSARSAWSRSAPARLVYSLFGIWIVEVK